MKQLFLLFACAYALSIYAMGPEITTSPLESMQREDALKILDEKLERALAECENLRCKRIDERRWQRKGTKVTSLKSE